MSTEKSIRDEINHPDRYSEPLTRRERRRIAYAAARLAAALLRDLLD
jgi:hypothetical protein